MAVITTATLPKLLWEGLQALWGENYGEHSQEWREIFDVSSSSKAYEEDQQTVGVGLASVKSEGAPFNYDTFAQGWTKRYTPVVYANGLIVSEESQEDNQYKSVANAHAKRLGFGMRQTKEIVHANVLNRANTAGYTGGDGSTLLATDHTMYNGSTFSNLLTADLSELALETIAIRVMDATDDRGKKIALQPGRLIIPTALAFEAERILKSSLQNDTANNAINALRSKGVFSQGITVNHFLTDADAWFVKTNAPEGLKSIQRRRARFMTDNDFDTGNMKMKSDERYAVGWTDPRGLYGSIPA